MTAAVEIQVERRAEGGARPPGGGVRDGRPSRLLRGHAPRPRAARSRARPLQPRLRGHRAGAAPGRPRGPARSRRRSLRLRLALSVLTGRGALSAEGAMTALVDLRDVGKAYVRGTREVVALREVTLQIEEGESVAVTGPSGSGKSTLLSILGCLDRPTTGRIPAGRHRRGRPRRRPALARAQPQHRLRLPGLPPHPAAHGGRERRDAAPLRAACRRRAGASAR